MLNIQNLKCYHGRIQAIKGVDLFIGKGELVTLVGANGSGKSTLVQAVCGLLNEWKGEIRFENELLAGLKPSSIVKRGISMVPEGRMIFSTLSVLDNLKLGAYTRYRKKEWPKLSKMIFRWFWTYSPYLRIGHLNPRAPFPAASSKCLPLVGL